MVEIHLKIFLYGIGIIKYIRNIKDNLETNLCIYRNSICDQGGI